MQQAPASAAPFGCRQVGAGIAQEPDKHLRGLRAARQRFKMQQSAARFVWRVAPIWQTERPFHKSCACGVQIALALEILQSMVNALRGHLHPFPLTPRVCLWCGEVSRGAWAVAIITRLRRHPRFRFLLKAGFRARGEWRALRRDRPPSQSTLASVDLTGLSPSPLRGQRRICTGFPILRLR